MKKYLLRFISVILLSSILFISNCIAQYTKLLDFMGTANISGTTQNGLIPCGSFVSDGSFLYGMTSQGGINNSGTIFKVKPDGGGYVKLLDFTGTANGNYPQGSLIYQNNFLYGMTYQGGANDMGTVFKIKRDGTGYTKLLDFAGTINGSNPFGSLFTDGTFLYGTTTNGGTNNMGTIFKIKQDGSSYLKLFDFAGAINGKAPTCSLMFDGTFLYGTTSEGGTNNQGSIFKIKSDGTAFAKLLDFVGTSTGANPQGDLISDGTTLFGLTNYGGTNSTGTIFKIMTDGTSFSKLYDFDLASGAYPYGSLVSDGTFLYGMTYQNGANGLGTIFKIKPDGTLYSKLLDFDGINGGYPRESLISDGVYLYGMTSGGGTSNAGAAFKIKFDGTDFSSLLDFAGIANGSAPIGDLLFNGGFVYGMTNKGGANNIGAIYKIKSDGTGVCSNILNFTGVANGKYPQGSLISDGIFLYGMTYQGGTNNLGTIFKIKFDGTSYTKILDFNGTNGSYPGGSFYYDGTFLYGMTGQGGSSNMGTVFKIKTDGTGYVDLLDFTGTNGSNPHGSLISDGTFLFGMTQSGGTYNYGNVFKAKLDGTGYISLFNFNGGTTGANPYGSLIYDGTYLYGTTKFGGTGTYGTLFKIKSDGTGYVKMLDFIGASTGMWPGSLISDGTFLYGMTQAGGLSYCNSGCGVIYRIKPDGTGFIKMQYFYGSNGAVPQGSLTSDGTFLYGMTNGGGISTSCGSAGCGVVFKYCITPVTLSQSLTVCAGNNVTIGNHIHSASGTFKDTLSSYNGCDSIVTTHLTVLPANTFIQSRTICSGQSVTVGSYTHTASGTYRDSLISIINGCDSIVTTYLTVLSSSVTSSSQTFIQCAGHSITVGVDTYTTSGTYTYHYVGSGCDSAVTTYLTILPINSYTQSPIICAGQSKIVGAHVYSISGTYHDTLISYQGCDSIVNTLLTVVNPSVSVSSATVCQGQSINLTATPSNGGGTYLWNTGSTIQSISVAPTSTTTYTVTYTLAGCSRVGTGTVTVPVISSANLPFAEDFQGATFVPAGWSLYNPNSNVTWVKNTSVGGFGTSSASAMMDNFSGTINISGQKDAIRTPKFDLSASATASLKFDVAYARYSSTLFDSLNVYVTTNCGNTWSKIFGKGSTALATAPDKSASIFVPTAAQWRTETINLVSYLGQPNVQFSFENRSGFGQALYLDSINITGTFNPASITISQTSGTNPLCSGSTATYTATPFGGGATPVYQWKVNGINTGANSSTFSSSSLSTNDTVKCIMTSSITGIPNNPASSNSIIVTVNTSPSTPTITTNGAIAFCQGDSVILTSSVSNSYLWSNGATTQSITISSSQNDSVKIIDVNGCSATSTATAVVVHPLPSAIVTPNGSLSFCLGDSVTLSVSASNNYLWSNGSTTQNITVSSAQNDSVTVTDINGCSATSSVTIITVNPLPSIPTITTNGSTTFCQGDTVILTASASNDYLWSNGAITQSITVLSSQNDSVTIKDVNGCSATSSATIITVNPLPSIPIITTNGVTSFCQGDSVVLTSSISNSYLWSNGATSQSLTISSSQSDSVIVTDLNGCSAISSATTVVVHPLPSAVVTPNGTLSFCLGDSVTLSVSPSSNYLWSNGSTTQNINVSSTQNDSVTVTDINGCSATSSATIVTVNPLPSIPTITNNGSTTFCQGDSVILTASASNTYLWSNGATSQNVTITSSQNDSVTVTDINGCSATSSATIVTVLNDCNVWPGDANNDSLVNNFDLLPIGLYYSQIGAPRASISNAWQAYPATNWGTLQTNGSDIKHADCNGDGLIDNNDTLAINMNFSSIHAIVANNFNQEKTPNPDLYFVTGSNSYNAGDWVDAEVWAGNSTMSVSDLYGIAFNIIYDASLVQPGTESLTYPNSWLGTPGTNAITIAKIDAYATTAYGGITRINHSNANGFGKIADFKFQTKSNITSASVLQLAVSNYMANDANDTPVVFNTFADSISIIPLATGVVNTNTTAGFSIYPNPFTSQTTITFNEIQKNTTIKIIDVLGKEIKTINFTGKQLIIEKGEMQSGIYFVQVTDTTKNVVNKRIVIQ